MEPQIIRAEDLEENDFGSVKVKEIIDSDEFPNYSLAVVEKMSDDPKTGYNTKSDTIYYVLEGEGVCVVNGKEYHVKKGDCFLCTKGTKYKTQRGLTFLTFSYSRFDRNKQMHVD